MEDTNTKTEFVGDLKVTLESEVYDNKILDTKVTISGGVLCYVAGNERDNFLNELQAVIDKHRI